MATKEDSRNIFALSAICVPICIVAACCIACVLVILACFIFIPSGIRTVKYDEYGLFLDTITRTVDQQGYEPGRYLKTISTETILLPATYKTISFTASDGDPLTSRTQDGLSISVDVSFQYRINSTENVIWIFNKFAKDYEATVIRIARDILRRVTSSFNAGQFFTDRREIGTAMFRELRDELEIIRIQVGYLQLRSIDLPDDFENIIESHEILRQEISKVEYDQQSALVNAETEVIQARKQAEIVKINSEASAEASILYSHAAANRTLETVAAYSTAYEDFINNMNFNSTDLLSYAFIDALVAHDPSKMLVNLNKPSNLNF